MCACVAKQKTAVEMKNKYAYVKQKAAQGVAQTAAEASAKLEPSSRRPSKLNLQFLLMASFAWQRHKYAHTHQHVHMCVCVSSFVRQGTAKQSASQLAAFILKNHLI